MKFLVFIRHVSFQTKGYHIKARPTIKICAMLRTKKAKIVIFETIMPLHTTLKLRMTQENTGGIRSMDKRGTFTPIRK